MATLLPCSLLPCPVLPLPLSRSGAPLALTHCGPAYLAPASGPQPPPPQRGQLCCIRFPNLLHLLRRDMSLPEVAHTFNKSFQQEFQSRRNSYNHRWVGGWWPTTCQRHATCSHVSGVRAVATGTRSQTHHRHAGRHQAAASTSRGIQSARRTQKTLVRSPSSQPANRVLVT